MTFLLDADTCSAYPKGDGPGCEPSTVADTFLPLSLASMFETAKPFTMRPYNEFGEQSNNADVFVDDWLPHLLVHPGTARRTAHGVCLLRSFARPSAPERIPPRPERSRINSVIAGGGLRPGPRYSGSKRTTRSRWSPTSPRTMALRQAKLTTAIS